jgi:type II secretory pathway pseudopilin PulG
MRTGTRKAGAGFTLMELAVVFTIVALLLGSLMYTLSAQVESRNIEETRRRLDQARELILSHAVLKGRLPCPARYTSSASHSGGLESFCTTATAPCTGLETTTVPAVGAANHGYCFAHYDGHVPAVTLGLSGTDSSGFALDAWGNRLRYVVTRSNDTTTCTTAPPANTTPLFTHSANLSTYGIACQPNDLLVCRTATGITASACQSSVYQVMTTSTVVAIIYSTGKNGASGSAGIDEAANLDGNATFVHHPPTPVGSANGEFDDQLTWITAGEYYGRMIGAGRLP